MSRRLTILQLVPRLKPAICGVGDYALELARALRDHHGIDTRFLVADPAWRHGATVDGFDVAVLPSRTPNALSQSIAASESEAVVVQYSGYGFSERGAPLWLAQALRKLCVTLPSVHLVTMFHELYATGPAWRSSFWLSYPQRWIASSIAQVSHQVRTNRRASACWVERAAPRHHGRITVQPVFSNLGEAKTLIAASKRENRLLLFQPPCCSQKSSRAFWDAWRTIDSMLHPEETVVAGRCGEVPDPSRFQVAGFLPAADASRLFSESRYCLTDYYDGYLGKSGVFAAIAAHGAGCLLARTNHSEEDGLREGTHYVIADKAGDFLEEERLDEIARAAWEWYGNHSIEATAASYADNLRRLCS